MRWRYHYPQREFPYERPGRGERPPRSRLEPEYELLDTGVFDEDRYWAIEVDYAKADPDRYLACASGSPTRARRGTLHVLPTLWFRNTWSWGVRHERADRLRLRRRRSWPSTARRDLRFCGRAGPGRRAPPALFCENETNAQRLFGSRPTTPYPKDGINDHVDRRRGDRQPATTGTKAAWWYRCRRCRRADGELAAAALVARRRRRRQCRLRLVPRFDEIAGQTAAPRRTRSTPTLMPAGTSADEAQDHAAGVRRADLGQAVLPLRRRPWLDGDPASRRRRQAAGNGRNARLAALRRLRHHVDARPVGVPVVRRLGLRVPYASRWRTSIRRSRSTSCCCCAASGSCTPTARYPPTSGRSTTSTRRCRRGRRSRCSRSTAAQDVGFPQAGVPQAAAELHLVGQPRRPPRATTCFEGGFLGLDNIGAVDRSHLPAGVHAGADRRNRLDGVLRADDAGDRAASSPSGTRSTRTSR